METIIFNNCTAVVFPDNGYTETKFDDNTNVPAFPQDNPTYLWTVKNLGYPEPKLMTIEHELLHTFLCEECGLEYSPTLWSVAHQHTGPGCIPIEKQWEEEAVVMSFQKFLNTKEVEPPLETYLKENSKKIQELKKHALKLLEFIGR